jgi:hypothetical protein
MPSLTIKGIPDELLNSIRRSAEANRRSINSEVLMRLERSAGLKPNAAEEMIARVRQLNERVPLPPLTEEFLMQAKAEGRP